ncbi:MAG: ASCH domain-containing protein [Candidatus Moraniibacteriota bacterium]
MKTLKFTANLVPLVLSGEKTVTWRMFDDKELSVGDMLELLDWGSGEKFSEAKITKVREKKLGEIEDEDFEGHERFENKEEMLETYRKYYGERVDWDTMVKMINFKLFEDTE